MKLKNNPKEIVDSIFDDIEEVQKQAQLEFEEMEKELFGNSNNLNDVNNEKADTEDLLRRFLEEGLQSTKVKYERTWKPNRKLSYRWTLISRNSRKIEMTEDVRNALRNEDVYYVYYNGNRKLYSEKINSMSSTIKIIPNDVKYDRVVVEFPSHPQNNYVAWDIATKEMVQIDDNCRLDDFGNMLPLNFSITPFETKILLRCKLDNKYNPIPPKDNEIVKVTEKDQKVLDQIRANFM